MHKFLPSDIGIENYRKTASPGKIRLNKAAGY